MADIKRGESIFIPFRNGMSIYDSQCKPRMYKTIKGFEKHFPGHYLGKDGVELVEYVEVVHGRWEPELMPTGVEYTGHAEMTVQALSCSVCGKCVDVSESYFSYCPHCGAKMDGDGNGT